MQCITMMRNRAIKYRKVKAEHTNDCRLFDMHRKFNFFFSVYLNLVFDICICVDLLVFAKKTYAKSNA